MIECAFASQTDRGTLCRYDNIPCYSNNGWNCARMDWAVEEFEGLLSNNREANWSVEFMESVVRKYGGNDD